MARKAKKKKKMYFTQVHEDAIVKYANSESYDEKNQLYEKIIQPAFDELVDKIVYTYKLTGTPNIDILKNDCQVWLVTILDKFDPTRGSKAFAYFTVIVKHWFFHKSRKNTKRAQKEVSYDAIIKELECLSANSDYNLYYNQRTEAEFWEIFKVELDRWSKDELKTNEQNVIEAVKLLFDKADDIDIFNKKAIYLYLREITGLNTKQIVNALKKFREKYSIWRRRWERGEIERT